MSKLLVLAAGLLQIPVIRKAREMGHYVIAIDGNPDAPGLKYADKAYVADIVNEDITLDIARKEQIEGVIHPCSEVSMSVMGRITDELHLSGIGKETAIKATNKHLMRLAFEDKHVSSIKSFLANSPEEAFLLLKNQIKGDAILKPSRNSGSRGIAKINPDIPYEDFLKKYRISLAESRDHSVLIEEFVDGPEFSVEIIVYNHIPYVLAVTDKKTTGAPHFVELGHNQPSLYAPEIVSELKNVAVEGVLALGLNDCAAHAELKIYKSKAYIIEIGARLGGDFISTELVHLSTGIDMVAAAIDVAFGKAPKLKPVTTPQGVAIRYFTPEPGILKDIRNTDILSNSSVYDCKIYVKEGDVINPISSSSDRSGHVIVVGKTAEEAVLHADAIIRNVQFFVDRNNT